MSALIIDRGQEPSFHHENKIHQAFEPASTVIEPLRVSEADLEEFRARRNGVRYSMAEVGPRESVRYLRLANRAITAVMAHLAQLNGKTLEELDEDLEERVFGYRYSLTEERVQELYGQLQWQLEVEGEQSGSKLGNKVLNTTRLIAIKMLSEDQDVRNVFASNEIVVGKVVDLYSTLIALVDHPQLLRWNEQDSDRTADFTLSIRLSYTGMTMTQMAEDFWNADRMTYQGEQGKTQCLD